MVSEDVFRLGLGIEFLQATSHAEHQDLVLHQLDEQRQACKPFNIEVSRACRLH